MTQKHHQIIIIGGGTGGIMTAAQLQRKSNKKLDIAIIEPSQTHVYQPAFTLVGAGTFNMNATKRKESKYIPKGVEWIKDKATLLDPDNNKVSTENNGDLTYDYLVLSPGLLYNLDLVEGLKDAMGKNDVCSNYIDPEYTWETVKKFKGGNALYTQPVTPIKCGGAPQKAMYMGEDYFRKNKAMRDKSNVIYAFPGTVVFGVEVFKKRLHEIADDRSLILKHTHQLYKVDGEKKIAYFHIPENVDYNAATRNDPENKVGVSKDGNDVQIPYDMLHLAPPHEPPAFIRNSKTSVQEGPMKGYTNVDKYTCQNPDYPNVFALGDSSSLPAAKTGAAIRKQTPVLVEHLLAQMTNEVATSKYNGYSSCPIVTGYGKMLLCEFDYDNNQDSDPILSKMMDTTKDSWFMWILKKFGLPFLYWNLMLKGKM